MSIRTQLAELLVDALKDQNLDTTADVVEALFGTPPKPEMGDISIPTFVWAKDLRNAPPRIAASLVEAIAPQAHALEEIASIEALGPYINIKLDVGARAKRVLAAAHTRDYGQQSLGEGLRVGIDFSSPNIAKPFGIGHLRSTAIGNSLVRIYQKLGYEVIRFNHLGDWGTQFGKLMCAFERWGDEAALEENPILHLYDLYVRFHTLAKEEPERGLEDEGRAWFKKLEDGDEKAQQYWERFRALSLREFERIYARLDVSFDHYWGEAYYNNMLDALVEDVRSKGLLVESEGAQVVPMDDLDLPPCLIVKNDGATLYATRDLAAARYRQEQYDFETFIYVVGAEQIVHFRQVFEVLRRMGYDWADRLVHVPFGRIHGISTRKGTLVFLEDILERGETRVREILADRNLPDDERETIVQQVTVGALIFYDLSRGRIKNYDFDWDHMLRGLGPNERGQTGPYLQYTHTRLASLVTTFTERYGAIPSIDAIDTGLLDGLAEGQIIAHIERFPEVIRQAAQHNEPSTLSHYAIELAELFNTYYSSGNRIVSDDQALSNARVALARSAEVVLAESLHLLGVPLPEKM